MRDILILLAGMMFISTNSIFASNHLPAYPRTVIEQDTLLAALPKVFRLGDHENEYEHLSEIYGTSLLEVSGDDFLIASKKWNTLLKEMEAHAEMIGYDIKGVKMWMHVFWDKKGKIQHIGYYLQPNSRNVKQEELAAFLTDFINNYYLPASYDHNFSHYTKAAFPTLNWKKKNELTVSKR